MASTTADEPQYGILRFAEPDDSAHAEDRELFALAASKVVHDEKLILHDARTDPNIVKGPAGLDVQGFAYIKHQSALTSQEWFTGMNIEEVYLPEMEKLLCEITGAKRAVTNNAAFRRRTADKQVDHTYVQKSGGPLDKEIAMLPKERALVYGKH